jgi:hypothetical protein
MSPLYSDVFALLVTLASVAPSANAVKSTSAASPPPCTAVPNANCCLTRVELFARGQRQANLSHAISYSCASGKTQRIPTTISIDLKPAGRCAQEALFQRPLRLVASGITLQRADGAADFDGTFRIGAPVTGGISTVYISGCIEILERVGSHHEIHPILTSRTPCEACDQSPHSEGWLTGTGTGEFAGTLRAVLVASSFFPTVTAPTASFMPTIDGVWLKCP